ncbi:arf-GAP with SH3 domain, ANK repeat and PH domain-containing protein 1-like, partial [Notechis scutatus]|uniref:Arf-GAP with SH3 domain, ANK repeat and PH domain-containing protein 1-like n=1 Tax=Notechis scutatus TaxID=8663 RepID=A0A6J1W2A7_9SAUR
LRKVWQKRKCTVRNGYFTISHSTLNRLPVKLNLLTCQVKPNADDKKCFDLISHNRTYHFLAEDEQECNIWISVLSNSKEEALNVAFKQAHDKDRYNMENLTGAIIEEIKHMPGNNMCCDCSTPDPAWLSINLGVLICIECSGIHRELGVHHSRIQSLALDKLATSELLLAKNIGNSRFNDIVEANLPNSSSKPTKDSAMTHRKHFIISKYVDRKYVIPRIMRSPVAKLKNLEIAVKEKDIFILLQGYAEKMNLSEPVLEFSQEPRETLLHLAVLLSDRTSLHIVDFLVQNSGSLLKQTSKGNTPLHYCSLHNKPECIKLLLRAKANITITNEAGETALDIASLLNHTTCKDLKVVDEALKISSSQPSELSEDSWQQAALEGMDSEPNQNSRENHRASSRSSESSDDIPPPLPKRGHMNTSFLHRVRALYDCQADHEDELTFVAGEIIIVEGQEDSNWWHGRIEGYPHRKGVFPVSFVYILPE